MIFLKAVWMRSKRLASSGSWSRMSSLPMKMASRYCHLACTFIHTSMVSEMVLISPSHFLVCSRKGATKRLLIMLLRFIIWSSSVCVMSSVPLRMRPRSCGPLKYLTTSKRCSRHVSAIALMPTSMLSSLSAPPQMAMMSSSYWSRLSSKRLPSVKVRGFMSKVFPVSSISLSQCRSRRASPLRFCMSGRLCWKPLIVSSTMRKGPSPLISLSILPSCSLNPSMPCSG